MTGGSFLYSDGCIWDNDVARWRVINVSPTTRDQHRAPRHAATPALPPVCPALSFFYTRGSLLHCCGGIEGHRNVSATWSLPGDVVTVYEDRPGMPGDS